MMDIELHTIENPIELARATRMMQIIDVVVNDYNDRMSFILSAGKDKMRMRLDVYTDSQAELEYSIGFLPPDR